jgi:dienelactone hydrolase
MRTKIIIYILLFLLPQILISQSARDTVYQINAVRHNLPVFSQTAIEKLDYPLSWLSGSFKNFTVWKKEAAAKLKECLLKPPTAVVFNPIVIAEQDRGSYTAQKIVFNVSAESRVLAYLLIPKGNGPFPAVLLLHDHGARFDIGKEKMIEPFADSLRRMLSAHEWVDKNYGGRFVGDELAKRGYICLATDALNWSDRGGGGYDGQQAIASNLFNMGMSYGGLIAWEDMFAAEFLSMVPKVDSSRIIALGFSMGSFRAWQTAALSDKIAGSVSICWMATHKGLLVPGGNLTRGQSSFTTTHPNIANLLDYPDVASIACPKPALFYNGEQDKLFPVESAREAFQKMHSIWNSQHADDKLETKIWPVGHTFNIEMQESAFNWLDKNFKK